MSRWHTMLNTLKQSPERVQNVHNVQKGVRQVSFEHSEQHQSGYLSHLDVSALERSALIEANRVPREWADAYAMLCAMKRPISLTKARWEEVLNDGGLFMDRWLSHAMSQKWTPAKAFDLNKGFVPLIQGGKIVRFRGDIATLRSHDRKSHWICRFMRLPGEASPSWRVIRSVSAP